MLHHHHIPTKGKLAIPPAIRLFFSTWISPQLGGRSINKKEAKEEGRDMLVCSIGTILHCNLHTHTQSLLSTEYRWILADIFPDTFLLSSHNTNTCIFTHISPHVLLYTSIVFPIPMHHIYILTAFYVICIWLSPYTESTNWNRAGYLHLFTIVYLTLCLKAL